MLHIHNGGSTAGTLTEFGFHGEHKAFQEVLMEGPAPGGLSPDEWLEVRARFLAEAYELKLENCEKDLREQEAWLRRFSDHDETILWFEHDLFCQINLIYLLDWFSKQSMGKTRLSLILFPVFAKTEPVYGMGDSQFWCALKRLGKARHPLITIIAFADDEPALKRNLYYDASFELTETGKAGLAGETDFIETNGIELWLGGVHLVDGAVWRWDERKRIDAT